MIKLKEKTFSDRLKELRREMKMSQIELAKKVGFSVVSISKFETGTFEPRMFTLIIFAEFFNVSIDYLTGITDERKRY